jgi:ABC-type multidrug transport system ATPase subunit
MPETKTHTVLFSSHVVSDLERAASKVWIIKDGRHSRFCVDRAVLQLGRPGRLRVP